MLSDLSRLEERRVQVLQSCKNSVVFQFSSHRYRSLIDALFQLLAIYVAVEVQSRKNDVSICLVLPVFVVVFGCQLEFMSLQSRCILTARYMNSSVLKKNYFFSTKEYLRNCFIWFEIYLCGNIQPIFCPFLLWFSKKKCFSLVFRLLNWQNYMLPHSSCTRFFSTVLCLIFWKERMKKRQKN